MIRLLTAISISVFLVGCSSDPPPPNDAHSPAPANAKQLSGAEIQQVLIGRKFESQTERGLPFWQILTPDGGANIKISSYPEAKGSWAVTGDVICVTYVEYGKECNTVHSDGSSYWLIDENKKTTNNKFSTH